MRMLKKRVHSANDNAEEIPCSSCHWTAVLLFFTLFLFGVNALKDGVGIICQ